jgi:hypothetical protein
MLNYMELGMKKRIVLICAAVFYVVFAGCNSSSNSNNSNPVATNPSLLAPMLYLPADGATNLDTCLSLSWIKVNDAAVYDLQVSTSRSFTHMVFTDSMIIGDSSLISRTVLGLACNLNYYWRVRSRNSVGTSSWSAIRSFTTEDNTSPSHLRTFFAEGFEGNLSAWKTEYVDILGDPTFPRMRITSDVAHTGTYSLTSDANRTALVYNFSKKLQDSIVGLQCYIMAKELGNTNFTVQLGQDAGSSGGLAKKFGFGFSPDNSVITIFYDDYSGIDNTAVQTILLNHWYKCVVEVDFTTKVISYYLDDQLVHTATLPTMGMYGIDKLLAIRGFEPTLGQDGTKKYYIDDIVLYRK